MLPAVPPSPGAKKKRHPVLVFLAGTFFLLSVSAAAAYLWRTQIVIPQLRSTAERDWAEMGRSMPQFERALGSIAENDSLRELTQDLQSFGITTLYKAADGESEPNTFNIPHQISDFLDSVADRG